jgi:F0F1-type ATP synthase, subunit b
MINERSSREVFSQSPLSTSVKTREQTDLDVQPLSNPVTTPNNQGSVNEEVASSNKPDPAEPGTDTSTFTTERDAGIPDEVWYQLEKDKALAEAKEKEFLRLKDEEEEQKKEMLKLKAAEEKAAQELEEAKRKADEDAKIRHEQARLQLELERRRQEAILEKIRKQQEALAEARRKEQANQMKLRSMGVCVQGYQWLKQNGGYRCAGGYHWVSDGQLGSS